MVTIINRYTAEIHEDIELKEIVEEFSIWGCSFKASGDDVITEGHIIKNVKIEEVIAIEKDLWKRFDEWCDTFDPKELRQAQMTM